VQAVVGTRAGARSRLEAGRWLVPAGAALTLVGVVGDLVVRTLAPAQHLNDPLLVLSFHGTDPWHLVSFAGLFVTTLGAVRWASRLGTELGNLLGAVMALLLAAASILGVWSGWQARTGQGTVAAAPSAASVAAAAARIAAAGPSGVAVDIGSTGAGSVDGVGDLLTGSTGAEGGSILGHVHGTPGTVSPEQAQILDRQLSAAMKATVRYRSIEAARKDGYIQVTQFIPGLGLHMANLDISNKVFDPAHPQVLLYQPKANGSLALVGVAYSIAHTGPGDQQPVGFAGNADVWHFHQNLCFLPTGSVTITPDRAACRSRRGYFQANTAWLLHAWIWKTNPDGVFTEYNPRVF